MTFKEYLLTKAKVGIPFIEKCDGINYIIVKVNEHAYAFSEDGENFYLHIGMDGQLSEHPITLLDYFEDGTTEVKASPSSAPVCVCDWISVLQEGCHCGSIQRYKSIGG